MAKRVDFNLIDVKTKRKAKLDDEHKKLLSNMIINKNNAIELLKIQINRSYDALMSTVLVFELANRGENELVLLSVEFLLRNKKVPADRKSMLIQFVMKFLLHESEYDLFYQKCNEYLQTYSFKDEILSIRAAALTENKKYNDSIADYSELIEMNPDDLFLYASRGYNYSQTNNYSGAINDFTHVIDNQKADGTESLLQMVFLGRGVCRFEQEHEIANAIEGEKSTLSVNKLESIWKDFNNSVKIKSSEIGLFYKAKVEFELSEYKEAIESLDQLIKKLPKDDSLMKSGVYFLKAKSQFKLDKFRYARYALININKSISIEEDGISKDSNDYIDPDLLLWRSKIYWKLFNIDKNKEFVNLKNAADDIFRARTISNSNDKDYYNQLQLIRSELSDIKDFPSKDQYPIMKDVENLLDQYDRVNELAQITSDLDDDKFDELRDITWDYVFKDSSLSPKEENFEVDNELPKIQALKERLSQLRSQLDDLKESVDQRVEILAKKKSDQILIVKEQELLKEIHIIKEQEFEKKNKDLESEFEEKMKQITHTNHGRLSILKNPFTIADVLRSNDELDIDKLGALLKKYFNNYSDYVDYTKNMKLLFVGLNDLKLKKINLVEKINNYIHKHNPDRNKIGIHFKEKEDYYINSTEEIIIAIFDIIFSNALKHNKTLEKIELTFKLLKIEKNDKKYIELIYSNNGEPGIPPFKEIKKEKYNRVGLKLLLKMCKSMNATCEYLKTRDVGKENIPFGFKIVIPQFKEKDDE